MKPVVLSWEGLCIETIKKKKRILNENTGHALPGEVFAILGPSGAGKTTLLDELGNRKKSGSHLVAGRVLFNGLELTTAQRRDAVSFVAQDDYFFESFTVFETLQTAFRFRYGYGVPHEEMLKRVNKLLEEMGLVSCSSVRIGGVGKQGLSGGQRRRLSIAVELVASASVLLLDEPTSGLDAAAAMGVMKKVKYLARQGHTIGIVIHQPASDIWVMFDRLMLLAPGGHIAYCGDAAHALVYFKNLGYECPPFFNQAEYVLDLVSTDFSDTVDAADVKILVDKFAQSSERKELEEQLVQALAPFKNASPHDVIVKSTENIGFFSSFRTMFGRYVINVWRNPTHFFHRLLVMAIVSVLMGLVFFQIGYGETDTAANATAGAIFVAPIFFTFMAITILPQTILDRAVVNRERQSNLYPSYVFSMSLLATALVVTFICSVLACLITFYMVGLQSFGEYLFMSWIMFLNVESVVLIVALLVDNHVIGLVLVMGYIMSGMMVAGFLLVFYEINWSVRWMGYITFNRYALRAFFINQFANIGTYSQGVLFPTGQSVLEFFGTDQDGPTGFWGNWAICLAFVLAQIGGFLYLVQTRF